MMKCPIDQIDLMMTERQGIEIDYCPKCRGVWLDRGELDTLIDRSDGAARPQGHQSHSESRHDGQRHGKRKSMLSELFDF
ncbi:zf-TFIIB domain-containing protein [Fodinicurvata halophila]|uniref:Zf-TFIIB domain-containing protein n=1 Tax=Fodinicurvata halophila TaxID=1419723 RepID=A0ABV8UM45_9PROT